MTWVRLDDNVPHHPKLKRAGAEAAWLWLAGIAWCNRFATDGHIPTECVGDLYPNYWSPRKLKRLSARLVECSLWEIVPDGYQIHDYCITRQVGNGARLWRSSEERARILERTGGSCAYCSLPLTLDTMEVDHVVPLSRGGTEHNFNVTAACLPCNRSKGARTPEEWRSSN